MKKLVLAIGCAAVLAPTLALAGEGERPTREERMQRMREHLELSDAQVEQIRQIRADGGGRDEVRAVLTDEQREKASQARNKYHRKQHQHYRESREEL